MTTHLADVGVSGATLSLATPQQALVIDPRLVDVNDVGELSRGELSPKVVGEVVAHLVQFKELFLNK